MQNNIPAVNLARQLNDIAGVTINWDQWQNFNLDFLGLEGVVLFQFLIYQCTRLDPKHEGWFYHSKDSIKKKTGISNDRLDSAVKKLVSSNILEAKPRGVPATLHYRIRFDQLKNREGLAVIYKNLTPDQESQLTHFFWRFVPTVERPERAKKPKAEKQSRDQQEAVWKHGYALRDKLKAAFELRHRIYTDAVKKHADAGLKPVPLRKLGSQAVILTVALKALRYFEPDDILIAAIIYFDALNFSLGGMPPSVKPIPLQLPVTGKNPVLVLLDEANNYAFLRACLDASDQLKQT